MNDAHSDPYRRTVRELSDRIVAAQRPIRILDAIKWDTDVQAAFFAGKFKRLPAVDRCYYQERPLKFDAQAKREEFDDIARDIRRHLGEFNPLGKMMERMCREYRDVVRMLETRGEREFSSLSRKLYGSATDAFHAGDPNLRDMAEMISDTLVNLNRDSGIAQDEKCISGAEAVEILERRLAEYFDGAGQGVQVRLDDGIMSDAAAGADYIKIRKDATFSERDVRALEIHEGWVHLGTTMNGMMQPVCTFLSKGSPSSTITQEGLAIISEVFYFASYPARVKRITNRIQAVSMAEQGANFIEVFDFYRDEGFDEMESYNNTVRVFRGSTPDGGPFTKDLVYSKGFVLIYNFIRLSVGRGLPGRIPLLFCGKTTLEDIRTISDLVGEGIVVAPRFLPPCFSDLAALTAWMCYSNFLNRLNLKRIESDYANLL